MISSFRFVLLGLITLGSSISTLLAATSPPGVHHAVGFGSIHIDVQQDFLTSMHIVDMRDLNRDGEVDLLAYGIEYTGTTVLDETLYAGISYGQPDGSFGTLQIVEIGTTDYYQNWALTAAQLDADSDAEIVFREGDDNAFHILQSGGESETVHVAGLENTNSNLGNSIYTSVQVGDLDGDGFDELVFNTTGGELLVRWSSRIGSDQIERVADAGLVGEFGTTPIDDYNADGLPDVLVYVEQSEAFLFWAGTGTDTLGQPVEIQTLPTALASTGRPLFGQLDANPAIDLIAPGTSPNELVYVYNLASGMHEQHSVDVGEPVYPYALVGDLDKSGIDDMVLKRDSLYDERDQNGFPFMGVVITHDPSPNHFQPSDRDVFQPNYGTGVLGRRAGSSLSPRVYGHDTDRDGDLDLVWAGTISRLNWTENRSSEPQIEPFGISSLDDAFNDGIHMTMLDVDDDGVDEAIVSGGLNARVIDLETGSWTRVASSRFAFMSLTTDLDGDGVHELIIPDTEGSEIRVFRLQADGSFAQRQAVPTNSSSGMDGFALADFNNDGLNDLVCVHSDSNEIGVYLADPDTLLRHSATIPSIDLGRALKPTSREFDLDGNADSAFGDDELKQIRLYRGLGDGTFTLVTSYAADARYWLISEDFDGDGYPDIAGCDADGQVEITYLGIDGSVEHQLSLYARGPIELVAADLNSDGMIDIAAACSLSTGQTDFGQPRFWLQLGDRRFSDAVMLPSRSAVGIASSDQNNDGANDLITLDRQMTAIRSHLASPPMPCPADINGDGELNFFDVSAFLVAFNDGDLSVDFNADGMLNFFDVSAFITQYAGGCP